MVNQEALRFNKLLIRVRASLVDIGHVAGTAKRAILPLRMSEAPMANRIYPQAQPTKDSCNVGRQLRPQR